jgi:hypothetical protein
MLWLSRVGLETLWCRGPNARPDCPRLEGDACPLREVADLAVVDVRASGEGELWAGWPERACTKVDDDGGTLFVDDRVIELGAGGRIRLAHPPTEAVMGAVVEEAVRPWARVRLRPAGG